MMIESSPDAIAEGRQPPPLLFAGGERIARTPMSGDGRLPGAGNWMTQLDDFHPCQRDY
jgi:hypothetical protein